MKLVAALIVTILIIAGVFNHMLFSAELFDFAKKRRAPQKGFSWIPFLNAITMGAVADSFSEENKTQYTVSLLVRSLFAIGVVVFTFFLWLAVMLYARHVIFMKTVKLVFVLLICTLALIFVLSCVLRYLKLVVCIYRVYAYAGIERKFKYLLLTLFVPFANIICLKRAKERADEVNVEEKA